MLPHPPVSVAVTDSIVEVLAVRLGTQKAIPGRRRESKKLVSLSCVELKAQHARVRVISGGIKCLASDVKRNVRPSDGLRVGRNVPPLHGNAALLAFAFGSKSTGRAKQCKPTEGALGASLLCVCALQAVQPFGECHA